VAPGEQAQLRSAWMSVRRFYLVRGSALNPACPRICCAKLYVALTLVIK